MEPAVTIILPVYNAERTLRDTVSRILDLAATPHRRLTLAIVDDGSTDDTFETACELARDYPQVRVFRRPHRGGLGPALEDIRNRLRLNEAIVHNGVGPVDLHELAALLESDAGAASASSYAVEEGRGSRRFAAAVTSLNARMADAHRKITSFHWMKLVEPGRSRRRATPLAHLPPAPVGLDAPVPLV